MTVVPKMTIFFGALALLVAVFSCPARADENSPEFESLIANSDVILLVQDVPFLKSEAKGDASRSLTNLHLQREKDEQHAREDGLSDRAVIGDLKIRRMRVVEVFKGSANGFVYLPLSHVNDALDNGEDEDTLFFMFIDSDKKRTLVAVTDESQSIFDSIRALTVSQ
jgi:hypothetical protein